MTGERSVILVGNFYPSPSGLAPHTTGLALQLSSFESVSRVTVLCSEGAVLPPGAPPGKIVLVPAWRKNGPASLLRTLALIKRRKRTGDLVLFNLFPNMFGTTRLSKVQSLAAPTVTTRMLGFRPHVYLHQVVRQLDLAALGYTDRVGPSIAFVLEMMLARDCDTFVPLRSQRDFIHERCRFPVTSLFIPYLEGVVAAGFFLRNPAMLQSRNDSPLVLLLGAWSPQRDLERPVSAIRALSDAGNPIRLVVAGHVNPAFPNYYARIRQLERRYASNIVRFLWDPTDEDIATILRQKPVMVLPYAATGGSSGVMNLAALFDLPIVATDLPMLREVGENLRANVTFVRKCDDAVFASTLAKVISQMSRDPISIDRLVANLEKSSAAVQDFITR